MKILVWISFLFLLIPIKSINARIYPVANIKEFNEVVNTLEAGDEVVFKNGVWKDVELVFYGIGTIDSPIVLRAETPGKVLIKGKSNLKLSGEYLKVADLLFTDGYTPSSSVIEFRNNGVPANNSVVTNCVIYNYSNPSKSKNDFWIQINGLNNLVEYCHLEGKTNKGMTLTVRLDSINSIETNHHIYRNYFGARPPLGANGGETIQIGLSETAHLNGWTKVDENFFEHCDGELEIISVKSSENSIINNVFKECKGMLTLRHGHRNNVYGNIFLGNNVEGTGVVRIISENQKVFNNFFSQLTGKGVSSAIVFVNGIPNAKPKEYDQVKNAVVFNNTFYECTSPFQLGHGNGPNRYMRAINSVVSNNLVYSTKVSNLINVSDKTDGILFVNNLMVNSEGVIREHQLTDNEVVLEDLEDVEGIIVPTSKYVGVMPNLNLFDKTKFGPQWYK